MKKFTLKGLTLVFSLFFVFTSNAQSWNISSDSFNALGEISETVTVEGLTLYAASDRVITVDENNKSLNGVDYTHRLKLGGSGSFDENGLPEKRVVSFDVTGDTKIIVHCMSSSSSSDRILNVAAGHKDSIIAEFQALGTSLTESVFNYVGEATKIFLYSPSSGVNIYYIQASPSVPAEQVWNISSESFNALGELFALTSVEGLTIYAESGKDVTVDSNNKSLDGMDFTHRLKLGGSGGFDDNGQPVNRVIAFNVNGNSKITVNAMSSSSSSDRTLNIAVGHKDSIIAEFPALGASLTQGVYNYVGGAATIFMYSPSSGVNIYYIKVEDVPTSVKGLQNTKADVTIYPNPADDKVFISVDEPTQVGVFNIAGSLLKSKMVQSKTDYINVGDLNQGVYFVRSLDSNLFSKKLIVK